MGQNELARDNQRLSPVQNNEILYRSVRGEEGRDIYYRQWKT